MNPQLFYNFGIKGTSQLNVRDVTFTVTLHYRNTQYFDIDRLVCFLYYEDEQKKSKDIDIKVRLLSSNVSEGLYTYECTFYKALGVIPNTFDVTNIQFFIYNKILTSEDYTQTRISFLSNELSYEILDVYKNENRKICNFLCSVPSYPTPFEVRNLHNFSFDIILRKIDVPDGALSISMYDTQQGNNVDTSDQMFHISDNSESFSFEIDTNGKWHNDLSEEEKNRIARELTVFRLQLHASYYLRISNDRWRIEGSSSMSYDAYLYTQEATPYLPSSYEPYERVLLENVWIEENQVKCNFYVQLIDEQTLDQTDPREVRIIINIIN
ncbi:hypothetical protein HMPREF1321_1048 [Capnocytophaga sp. oral taxon 412 str. F0487]|uniref:hypothetical protein n=1 Tax=Capnocytophaga sp. oral taxon 412 TaxID=712218 RepID=UPI0002696D7A|nr:hypothetical protein [Capnocytophaga sp. oral taxon 412]EIW93646.1 hypothetical protein HMPREF1321_1048 [Capnocytophaga sp. oral taxon 412 str. F0487]